MSDSTDSEFNGSVDLRLEDAALQLRFALPTGWIGRCEEVAPDAPPFHADWRPTLRFTAASEDGRARLRIAASKMKLPVGLIPAVVYWMSLYGLEGSPEETQDSSGFPALGGRFTSRDRTSIVYATWIQANDSVIELQLEGHADDRSVESDWMSLRESLECESLVDASSVRVEQPIVEPWWSRVSALRALGRHDEALALAERSEHDAESLLVQAELHAERFHRALAAHQSDAARDAWHRASNCAYAYAACATSGSEGSARSMDRDRVLRDLGPEPP